MENADKVSDGSFVYSDSARCDINNTLLKALLLSHHDKVLLFRRIVTLNESVPEAKMTLPPLFQDVSAFRMSTFNPDR